jgi:hypothetical protein
LDYLEILTGILHFKENTSESHAAKFQTGGGGSWVGGGLVILGRSWLGCTPQRLALPGPVVLAAHAVAIR